MTFFNKKEEAIQIELTPYGRSLLMKGELMPEFYAFFDDDVIYDSDAAGFSEDQTDIKTRIIDETPRLKLARDLQSPETLLSSYERTEESSRPHTSLKVNYLTEPLGTSDGASQFAPSWNATMIQGEISGSVDTVLSGSDKYLKQIPQINATIEYTMTVRNTRNDPPVTGMEVTPTAPVSPVFADGTYIHLEEEQIICQLLETNGFLFNNGLEVDVYLFDDSETENLIPLKFLPKETMIKDGILLDEQDVSEFTSTDFGDLDPKYVEYWVNFNVDKGINNDDICKGVQSLKAKSVEVSLEVECPDRQGIDFDIYGTRVDSIEDCE